VEVFELGAGGGRAIRRVIKFHMAMLWRFKFQVSRAFSCVCVCVCVCV
jgi:hypothetical protein